MRIVQFWHALTPPDDVAALMATMREMNPGASYEVFDYGTALRFVERHGGARLAAAYRQCRLPAMHSDIFRLCWLLTQGGVYVDAAFRGVRPLEELLGGARRGLISRRRRPEPHNGWALPNGFLYFREPGDPLLAAVIGDIVNNIETRSSNNPWLVTGPGAMSARYMAHLAAPGPDFAGIDVVEWEQLRPFVQMGAPQYKSLPDHWHTAYKTQSVFLPESERPTSWLERVRQRWSGRA